MSPPVDPDILSANPRFDALYRDISSNKLNADGTTKIDAKAQKDRDAFSEELRKARVISAKQSLIKSYLQFLAHRGDELPSDLQELVAVIAAALHSQISREDANLLREDVEKFKENIKPISKEIWKVALDDLVTLARISSPEGRSDEDDLTERVAKQKESIVELGAQMSKLRTEIALDAGELHALYRKAIETSIRILEQTIHGSVSRSTKAKADYLATVAEGMSKKLQIQQNQLLADTKSPELREALEAKNEDLNREALGLRRKIREAEDRLAEYRQNKSVEGIASEYAEILSEMQKVRTDIERLESRRK